MPFQWLPPRCLSLALLILQRRSHCCHQGPPLSARLHLRLPHRRCNCQCHHNRRCCNRLLHLHNRCNRHRSHCNRRHHHRRSLLADSPPADSPPATSLRVLPCSAACAREPRPCAPVPPDAVRRRGQLPRASLGGAAPRAPRPARKIWRPHARARARCSPCEPSQRAGAPARSLGCGRPDGYHQRRAPSRALGAQCLRLSTRAAH
mmetsp:Transcript_84236/g.168167  ORF Transcript_84236/g.168167 Transcript_84236/m.168167 type:complete len:205 (-) Transcript_84236:20-634(-)